MSVEYDTLNSLRPRAYLPVSPMRRRRWCPLLAGLLLLLSIVVFVVVLLLVGRGLPADTDHVAVFTPQIYFESHPRNNNNNNNNNNNRDRPWKILCWISSYEKNIQLAYAARDTWGSQCDTFLIMSTEDHLGTLGPGFVRLPAPSDYNQLWQRTILAMRHIWWLYKGEFDFVLKADDDTYVFMDNLRSFLSDFDPEEKLYFGQPLHTSRLGTYMSGGAGYVLSASAFEKAIRTVLGVTVDALRHAHRDLTEASGPEDAALGICMRRINATFVAGLDQESKTLFSAVNASRLKLGSSGADDWFARLTANVPFVDGVRRHFNCCAKNMISRHYVKQDEMWSLHKESIEGIS